MLVQCEEEFSVLAACGKKDSIVGKGESRDGHRGECQAGEDSRALEKEGQKSSSETKDNRGLE